MQRPDDDIVTFPRRSHDVFVLAGIITQVEGQRSRNFLYIARVDVVDQDEDYYEGCFLRKISGHVGRETPTFVVDTSDCGSFSKNDVMKKLTV